MRGDRLNFAFLNVGHFLDHHSARTVFAYVAGLQAVFFAVMYQLTGVAAVLMLPRTGAIRAQPSSA